MAFRLKEVCKLIELHRRIKMKNTGTPNDFAKSLGISRTWLYQNIDDLKILGADIKYSRINESFYYMNNFEIKLIIKIDEENSI